MSPPAQRDPNHTLMLELAEVKGMLKTMQVAQQQNHEATHQRINDFRHAVEGRIGSLEGRVGTLEKNERSTAIKSAGASAITLGVVELVKFLAGR